MYTLLSIAKAHHASDLQITVGVRPKCRISGTLYEMDGFDKLTPAMTKELVESMFGPKQKATMEATGEVDFAYTDTRVGRFRVNAFHQRGSYAAVLRIVASDIPTPEDLGVPEAVLGLTKNKRWLVLVTGPTGSGKSTTLYTALNELNVEGVNIITVEDPVEANLNGVNQVQVNEKAGLTFSSALRSILRQDPDIIMIGEIRDQETAEIAVKASITGHLVVSTLHTNSSANTITRLADMGVENYLIADSVVGVIAQRLVRRVCPACGIVREATAGEKKILGIKDPARRINVRTPGHKECVRCGGTGYYGRIGIYEIMPVTADLRQAINRGENADVLEEIALTHGMKTLRMSAIDYALRGITTVEEVQRVAYDDEED